MTYRNEARKHLRRSKEELETGDNERLKYAAWNYAWQWKLLPTTVLLHIRTSFLQMNTKPGSRLR